MKIFLEDGESPEDANDMLVKAITAKHEHSHGEEFEDALIEELLTEIDREMKRVVVLGGFKEAIEILKADIK